MRGTEAVTITADGRKPATFRAFPNTETLSGSRRGAQPVHAALGAAGHRLGQLALLVLTLWFALCAGTTDANALSASCAQINSDLSAGVTLDAASLPTGTNQFYREYDSLADGETLTWSVTGSGVAGSQTYSNFYVGNWDNWEHYAATDATGSIFDSGSHGFSSGDTFASIELIVNKSANPTYVNDPATVTLTASCSEGSPVTISLAPAAGSLANGAVGTAYTQTFTASGGAAPYTYAVTAGALPDGLTLASNG
ncbi:hypothetical protein, partial [Stappia indica]